MYAQTVLLSLLFATSAVAHSAVPMVMGDVGGGMTALGFNPDIPQQNRNKDVIEPDANTMPSNSDPTANGLGTLNQKKKVTMDMLDDALANAASTQLPQVNKQLNITYRQMVLDGRFDVNRGARVLVDTTASGNFKNAVEATINQPESIQVIKQPTFRGTTVVGEDFPISVTIPDSVQCTGPQNTCLVRVVNGRNEGNQLWGGHFLFQKAPAAGAAAPAPSGAPTPAPAAGSPAGARKMLRRDIQELKEALKKIQVRDETQITETDPVTEDDMINFEKNN